MYNLKYIIQSEQQKIQNNYLKGVTIKDLAIQYEQEPEQIEMILRNKGIEIIENKIPKSKNWKYKRKRK